MLLILVLIHAVRAAPPRKYAGPGFRVVRCFPKLSRRDADKAVCDGRVTVNGRVAKPALRVKSGDVVTLDGRKQDWEAFAASLDVNDRRFVVYNKPAGVTCTTDAQTGIAEIPARAEVLSAGRVFPVGRLDADSEGLVLLTDDGKCADALLQPKSKVAKTYVVEFERDVDDGDVTRLADGVEIETPQRPGATTTQNAAVRCARGRRRHAVRFIRGPQPPAAHGRAGSPGAALARPSLASAARAGAASRRRRSGPMSSRTSTRRLLRRQRGRGGGVGAKTVPVVGFVSGF